MRRFNDRNGWDLALGATGRIFHVDTVNGSDNNDGKFAGLGAEYATGHAFATMAKALLAVDSYDQIAVSGVVKEQCIAPLGVFSVRIFGTAVGSPRQATDSGVAQEGGACWLPPASPTAATALLELIQQGWVVEDLFMLPHTSSPGILLTRAEDAVHPDPSHCKIRRIRFGDGTTNFGVKDVGGCYNVEITDCIFQTDTGITNTATGVAVPTLNRFERNIFDRCSVAGILGSYNYSLVRGNVLSTLGTNSATPAKINLISVSAQGAGNVVIENYFPDVAANVAIAKGYKAGTGDVWRNYVTDTAAQIVTVPA